MNLNELIKSVASNTKIWDLQAQPVTSIEDYHFSRIPFQLTDTGFKTVIFPTLRAGVTISEHIVGSKGFINVCQNCYVELSFNVQTNEIDFDVSDNRLNAFEEREVNIATSENVVFQNSQGNQITLPKDRTNSMVMWKGMSFKDEIAKELDLKLDTESVKDLFKNEISNSNVELLTSCQRLYKINCPQNAA